MPRAGTDFRWQEQESLEQSSDSFWAEDRPLPHPTSTWHLSTGIAIPDWAFPGPLPSCCEVGYHSRQHLCPEYDPQGSRCLGVPPSPLSEPGSRQVRVVVYASIYVCPAVPALMESRSQLSLLCPAVEAEPACFWLPYMNH